jgi:hypothetical protein
MDNLIVPSSIQRIRAFLVELCGMKVKPWASAEETLNALHTTLVARQSCDIFWKSLQTLLETLARDMKARSEATHGALVDNEVLSEERFASLLDEIRACLARTPQESNNAKELSSFRRVAQGLSTPALGLLLLLGGVATVSCENSPMTNRTRDADIADTRTDQAGGTADAAPDSTPDHNNVIILPDMAPEKRDTVRALPDGSIVTIKNIMDSCNVTAAAQNEALSCLSGLSEAWNTGFAAYLSGKSCDAINNATAFCEDSYAYCTVQSTADFDPSQLPLCFEAVIIYLGVRFV